MQTVSVQCKDCGKVFQRPVQRGRPAVRCESCRNKLNPNPIIVSKDTNNPTPVVKFTNLTDNKEEEQVVPVKKYEKYDNNHPHPYRVMVGNLGLAYASNNEKEAMSSFEDYCKKSDQGYGQVGFERVQLWKLNTTLNKYEVVKSYLPERT